MPRWNLAVVKSLCETCDTETVPECHVELAMAPYVLPKQFQGIVNRYPWTETLCKNQAMSAEFPCPAAKNVFNLRFPGDYWSLQFTGEKLVELLALTGSPASLIYWLSQNILHTKSCIQKVHCAHCIPWKKPQLQNLNRRTIITMRLPLNKTHHATVIWRGAFILCFVVCVIRTCESHTFHVVSNSTSLIVQKQLSWQQRVLIWHVRLAKRFFPPGQIFATCRFECNPYAAWDGIHAAFLHQVLHISGHFFSGAGCQQRTLRGGTFSSNPDCGFFRIIFWP